MSDVAIRKKKNADAQAAFRARRANYIATLEETVTSLESVVLQLQESCRESRNEALELRQENDRLRLENRERDKFWRAHYQARKIGHPPDPDDHPPPPLSSPFLGQAQVNGMPSHQTPSLIQHRYPNSLAYRGEDYNNNPASANNNFANQPSSVPFSNNESSIDSRSPKYPGHPYALQGAPRDPRWSVPVQSGLNTDSATSPHSQSPAYIDSPSLATTDMSFTPRFSGEEQKVALSSILDNAPYVFPNGDRFHQNVTDSVPNSRSLSPTSSTPGSSSTSIPMTSSFQFTFSDQSSAGQDRAEFDYRRHSLPHCPEVTLHGGTADLSLTAQSADAVRYRIQGSRHNGSGMDHRTIIPGSENGDHGSSDGDPHLHRNTIHSHSRSPSPNAAPISCTVAVIKAQAFGALRRTRARTKKTSEGAAKVAMNVLEARGIGIGVPSKRPRVQDDEELDVETP